jgi:nucleoside-diphosphate-sugar epimerase
MKVLITGTSGFLGSWICRVLANEYEVFGLVRETSELNRISDLKNVEIVRMESSLWASFIPELRPDVLILNHWSGVNNENRNDPLQIKNVKAIQKMAEAAVVAGVKTIIGVGSQAELGPLASTISEFEIDNPTTAYGQAKVETRLAIEDLIKNTEVRFIWMRIFSTYGPLDEGTWLIPKIVDSLVNNQEMGLTKGEQEWSYLHAYDLASAFRTVIGKPGLKGIINVGNPQTISVYKVASIIGEILNKKELLLFGALDYRSDQVMRLEPLCESLSSAGWHPQISFEEGIRQTIDWLQKKPLEPLKTLTGKTLDFNLPTRP